MSGGGRDVFCSVSWWDRGMIANSVTGILIELRRKKRMIVVESKIGRGMVQREHL